MYICICVCVCVRDYWAMHGVSGGRAHTEALTGSGALLFCPCLTTDAARRVRRRLRKMALQPSPSPSADGGLLVGFAVVVSWSPPQPRVTARHRSLPTPPAGWFHVTDGPKIFYTRYLPPPNNRDTYVTCVCTGCSDWTSVRHRWP